MLLQLRVSMTHKKGNGIQEIKNVGNLYVSKSCGWPDFNYSQARAGEQVNDPCSLDFSSNLPEVVLV